MPSPPSSHIQLEWQIPECRRWYERLAQERKLVRYDGRGSGLSDRDPVDFSLEAQMQDLEAVVDRLSLDRFALFALSNSTPAAIAYAARHPERVSHLILWCGWARISDWSQLPQFRALGALLHRDWETYTETWMRIVHGWSAGEEAGRDAAFMRESITQQVAQAWAAEARRLDVTDLLPQVRSPTLVLHRRQLRPLSEDAAKRLASRIPEARLVLQEGETLAAWRGDIDAVLAVIDDFLDEGEEPKVEARASVAGTFRTVLFTDVEGSTALTQRLGDAKAREVLRAHERIVREALQAHGGSEVKAMGDGFMASFSSATRALECAIAMQKAFAERNTARPSTGSGRAEPIRVRIGLNAGEPIAEAEDLFGTAVNLAARIAAQAAGGEILVANVVRELAAGKGFLFADRGEVALRGFEEPVRLYEVRWEA